MAYIELLAAAEKRKKITVYKTFSFLFGNEKMRRKKKKEKGKKIIIICRISGLLFCAFLKYKENNNFINLSK